MIKHVGIHNQRKVVVVFREVPDEEHMALVTYPDTLPTTFHDDLMRVIESNAGQSASHLGEALHRMTGTDGDNLLNRIHREGWMKKVRTQDVLMTPQPGQQGARLDEINEIIRDLATGEDAAKRLAEMDANSGIADPAKAARGRAAVESMARPAGDGVLSDTDIAKNLMDQAEQMKSQISTMETEIARLTEEAYGLDPSLKPKTRKPRAKKSTTTSA